MRAFEVWLALQARRDLDGDQDGFYERPWYPKRLRGLLVSTQTSRKLDGTFRSCPNWSLHYTWRIG